MSKKKKFPFTFMSCQRTESFKSSLTHRAENLNKLISEASCNLGPNWHIFIRFCKKNVKLVSDPLQAHKHPVLGGKREAAITQHLSNFNRGGRLTAKHEHEVALVDPIWPRPRALLLSIRSPPWLPPPYRPSRGSSTHKRSFSFCRQIPTDSP